MRARIGLGLVEFPFQERRNFWRWIQQCEGGGIDAIWQADRLISAEPFLETMSLMAALCGMTERLGFGMDVVVVPFRDPLVLAKQCATVDFLSNGRLRAGFGIGPAEAPEWRASGRSTAHRGAQADEALALMQRLWSEERVTFAGRFYQYTEATIAPRPVQQPLPIWIGGRSQAAIQRAGRMGSGWFSGLATPEQVRPVIGGIRAEAEAAGRVFPAENFGADFGIHFGSWEDPVMQRTVTRMRPFTSQPTNLFLAVGGPAEIVQRMREFQAAGAHTFALRPLADTDAEVLAQTQRIIEEIVPAFAESAGAAAPPIP